MSRPFSYNDDNFTVIGNMLFIHIITLKYFKSGDIVVSIPPEITKRLFSSNITFCFEYTNGANNGSYLTLHIDNNNLVTSDSINPRILLKSIEPLKDI